MVEEAFKSVENYLECFKEIEDIYRIKEQTLKTIITELEGKFSNFLEKPRKQDEFLIPEIPRPKKEIKDKQEPSRASRRNESSVIQNDSEIIRRSSRIASKTKLKPSISSENTSKLESSAQNCTYLISPSHPPNKIRRTNEGISKKSDERTSSLEESVCTSHIEQPLGSSTPTSPPLCAPKKDEKSLEKENKPTADEKNKTPTHSTTGTSKGESVKKRIEEFENRAKGHLLPSKLPTKTPEKIKVILPSKNKSKISNPKKEVLTEDDTSITEPRVLRANSKILQEKNANLKLTKEKALEAQKKKATLMKASIEETKRKREERGRKVTAQREAAEREKQEAAMKLEKEREEKFKQMQKIKDEKLKEENEKKKQLAAMKAAEMEERRKEEEKRKWKEKMKQETDKLRKATFKLPNQTAKEEVPQYGIENVLEGDSSEDEDNPKKQIPSWATKKLREHPLNVQAWLNKKETIYPWFYNKNLKYPKLEELFSVEVKTRPRTSSAFWNSRITFNESFPLI